jgi:hypothetical protein
MFASPREHLTVLPAVLAPAKEPTVTVPSIRLAVEPRSRAHPLRVVIRPSALALGIAALLLLPHPLRLQPVSLHDPNQESSRRSRSCSAGATLRRGPPT